MSVIDAMQPNQQSKKNKLKKKKNSFNSTILK